MRSMRLSALCGAAAVSALLPGCMVVPPNPVYEAVSLASTALVGAASIAPPGADNAVVHEHARIDRICIQFNPSVQVADLVPAIQGELRDNSVDSRLYEPGMQPADCPALLYYSAFMNWDQRALNDEYSAYLTFASITLRSSGGQVLASANYESGQLGLDKWSSTRTKISALIKTILLDTRRADKDADKEKTDGEKRRLEKSGRA